jgi:hypothetical protein
MLAMTQHQEKKVLIPFIVKVTRSERIDSLCQKIYVIIRSSEFVS